MRLFLNRVAEGYPRRIDSQLKTEVDLVDACRIETEAKPIQALKIARAGFAFTA